MPQGCCEDWVRGCGGKLWEFVKTELLWNKFTYGGRRGRWMQLGEQGCYVRIYMLLTLQGSLARHPASSACQAIHPGTGPWKACLFMVQSVPAYPCKPRPCPARGKEMNLLHLFSNGLLFTTTPPNFLIFLYKIRFLCFWDLTMVSAMACLL